MNESEGALAPDVIRDQAEEIAYLRRIIGTLRGRIKQFSKYNKKLREQLQMGQAAAARRRADTRKAYAVLKEYKRAVEEQEVEIPVHVGAIELDGNIEAMLFEILASMLVVSKLEN